MNIYYLCKYLKERQRAFEGVVYNSLHANRLALGCLCLEARRDASASSLQGSSGHIFFSVYYRLSRLNWSSVLAWLRRQTFGCWLKAKKGNRNRWAKSGHAIAISSPPKHISSSYDDHSSTFAWNSPSLCLFFQHNYNTPFIFDHPTHLRFAYLFHYLLKFVPLVAVFPEHLSQLKAQFRFNFFLRKNYLWMVLFAVYCSMPPNIV